MLERKREVVAEHSTYYVCDVHGWDFTGVDEDVCPVCFGESLERDRIFSALETLKEAMWAVDTGYQYSSGNMSIRIKTLELAMSVIKGENK